MAVGKGESGFGQKKPDQAKAWSGITQVLELELQGKLYQASLSVADCTGHMSEVGVVRCAAAGIWRSELRMVKEVEKLSAEFDVAPFADGRLLEYGPVEVIDALLT